MAEITEEERQEIHEQLREAYEYTFDMDNLIPQKHLWVDRGAVMSCEFAGHANHRAFKRQK
jgi:hypothetical protein